MAHQGLAGAVAAGKHYLKEDKNRDQVNKYYSFNLIISSPSLFHNRDILPPEALMSGGQAAFTHDDVEERHEGDHDLQHAGDEGDGVEAVVVDQQPGHGPGGEPARSRQG